MKKDTLEGRARSKNGVKRLCFSVFCILLEAAFIVMMITKLNEYAEIVNLITRLFAGVLVLALYASDKTSSMKMPWVILILIFPIMGVALYLLIGLNGGTRKMRERYADIDRKLLPLLPDNVACLEKMNAKIPKAGNISAYIQRNAHYPVYQNTDVTYYDAAEKGLDAQLEDLSKAEKFIFMEYHAIEDDKAWKKIQNVLEEREKAGVEVRVFYDDMGSIWFVNMDFATKLKSLGIKCRVFNPILPGLNMFLNNRDHRKITVIDGKVAYTGGYNLANEYFNITHPYGIWKDTGIRMEGDAVNGNLTLPTDRVYFFIEKIPLDYTVAYEGSGQLISEEGAKKPLPTAGDISVYEGENRWIVMSRMYYWAQAFKERYPNDMKVYYESEDFVCYVMPQNMYHQYNFAIDYGYNQFRTQEDKN